MRPVSPAPAQRRRCCQADVLPHRQLPQLPSPISRHMNFQMLERNNLGFFQNRHYSSQHHYQSLDFPFQGDFICRPDNNISISPSKAKVFLFFVTSIWPIAVNFFLLGKGY